MNTENESNREKKRIFNLATSLLKISNRDEEFISIQKESTISIIDKSDLCLDQKLRLKEDLYKGMQDIKRKYTLFDAGDEKEETFVER